MGSQVAGEEQGAGEGGGEQGCYAQGPGSDVASVCEAGEPGCEWAKQEEGAQRPDATHRAPPRGATKESGGR